MQLNRAQNLAIYSFHTPWSSNANDQRPRFLVRSIIQFGKQVQLAKSFLLGLLYPQLVCLTTDLLSIVKATFQARRSSRFRTLRANLDAIFFILYFLVLVKTRRGALQIYSLVLNAQTSARQLLLRESSEVHSNHRTKLL